MSYELPLVHAAEADVLDRLEVGLNHIADNPSLETAYLHYEAVGLDALHKDSGLIKIEHLPDQQRRQIGQVATRLVGSGLISAETAHKRLQRIRVRIVEELTVDGKPAAGEFKYGLATVKAYEDPQLQNHAILHEVTHGLAVPGWAIGGLDFVVSFRGGLESTLTTDRQPVNPEYKPILHDMQEAIVDTTALASGNLNVKAYLRGEYQAGYAPEDLRLGLLTMRQPMLVTEAAQAVYKTGLQSNEQAERFVEAYSKT
jgi:hypothetical protein